MAIIHEWPREWSKYATSRFRLSSRSLSSISPFTGRANVYGPHTQMWVCEISLPVQKAASWMPMESLFSELGGPAGLLRIFDFPRALPQFTLETKGAAQPWSDGTFFDDGSGWRSEPLPPSIYVVTAAAMGESSVVVGGLPASTARVLRRNDLIEMRRAGVADETPSLHVITRDAASDATGKSRLQITPPLRKGVAAGDQVVLEYATGVFRLADADQGVFDRHPGARLAAGGFKLVEALL